MSRDREQLFKVEACRACEYCACICVWKNHAETCARRVAVLDRNPVECSPHGVIACADCHPCNCSARAELDRWMAAQAAKTDGLIAKAAAGKEAA